MHPPQSQAYALSVLQGRRHADSPRQAIWLRRERRLPKILPGPADILQQSQAKPQRLRAHLRRPGRRYHPAFPYRRENFLALHKTGVQPRQQGPSPARFKGWLQPVGSLYHLATFHRRPKPSPHRAHFPMRSAQRLPAAQTYEGLSKGGADHRALGGRFPR